MVANYEIGKESDISGHKKIQNCTLDIKNILFKNSLLC